MSARDLIMAVEASGDVEGTSYEDLIESPAVEKLREQPDLILALLKHTRQRHEADIPFIDDAVYISESSDGKLDLPTPDSQQGLVKRVSVIRSPSELLRACEQKTPFKWPQPTDWRRERPNIAIHNHHIMSSVTSI